MRAVFAFLLAVVLVTAPAAAQRPVAVGIDIGTAASFDRHTDVANPLPRLGTGGKPRWVKAAIAGGVAGGAFFAAMHWFFSDWNPQPKSLGHDVAIGVIGGAATAGATVAFYDWVCATGSASQNAGLCGSTPILHSRDYTRGNGVARR